MPSVPIRARDLRANIREMGFEKGVVATLEAVLEEQGSMRQTLRECAEALSSVADTVTKMVHVGEGVVKNIDELRRELNRGEHGE